MFTFFPLGLPIGPLAIYLFAVAGDYEKLREWLRNMTCLCAMKIPENRTVDATTSSVLIDGISFADAVAQSLAAAMASDGDTFVENLESLGP